MILVASWPAWTFYGRSVSGIKVQGGACEGQFITTMRFPSFNFRSQRLGTSTSEPCVRREFLVFGVPQEKFGHYTALVYHPPKQAFRVVVCRFGRMAKEIADAELLGEIRMRRPYAWDEVEEATEVFVELKTKPQVVAASADGRLSAVNTRYMGDPQLDGEGLFTILRRQNQDLQGKDVAPVAVYLVKVVTNRKGLLFDGEDATLPPGYLT